MMKGEKIMRKFEKPALLSPGQMRQQQIQPNGGEAPWAELNLCLPGAIRRVLNVPWPKEK